MWRVLFLMQTLMGHRRAAAGRPKSRALRREHDLTQNSFYPVPILSKWIEDATAFIFLLGQMAAMRT